VALEQHNTAFEFETMLRSHLSRGGSIVEACGGFDADTASAYLEDALGQPARSRYDTHLAGCPSCRRSVIELSRLIELEPHIAPAAVPSTGKSNWKSVVAGWFGLADWKPTGWNLAARHWGLATAGAASAILLAVLATQLWRQSPQIQQVAVSVPTSTAPVSVGSTGSSTPGETAATTSSEMQGQGQSQTSASVIVPAPAQIGPAQGQQDLAATVSDNLNAERNRSFGPETQPIPQATLNDPPLPPSAPSPKVQPVITNFSTLAATQQGNVFTPLVESEQVVVKPESVAKEESARIIAPINPSPNDNPMKRDKKPSAPRNIFDGGLAFVPRKDASERKLEPKDIETGGPKVLTVRVRDKVFSFQGGMWVDHAYKPEMAWRITKLTQDSDEYKKVLAEEPQLKDFFERGSVIVVWKDKIYKTTEK